MRRDDVESVEGGGEREGKRVNFRWTRAMREEWWNGWRDRRMRCWTIWRRARRPEAVAAWKLSKGAERVVENPAVRATVGVVGKVIWFMAPGGEPEGRLSGLFDYANIAAA